MFHFVLDLPSTIAYNKNKKKKGRGTARIPGSNRLQTTNNKKGARTMENMDMMDQISELKNTILSLKAVAVSFSRCYTEGTPEANLLAVQIDPENYCYLFHVITDQICEAKQMVEALEAEAEKKYCRKD
jgi:hypothetical protein